MARRPSPNAQRFGQLLSRIIRDNDRQRFALMLGVSEGTIRNWTEAGSGGLYMVPGHGKMREVLLKLGFQDDVLSCDDQAWQKLIEKIQRIPYQIPSLMEKPHWLYLPEDINLAEKNLEPGQYAVLITSDAYNDTHRKETWELVKANLKRGVSYLYVIPDDCENKDVLTRNVVLARRELTANTGNVAIMVVASTEQTA